MPTPDLDSTVARDARAAMRAHLAITDRTHVKAATSTVWKAYIEQIAGSLNALTPPERVAASSALRDAISGTTTALIEDARKQGRSWQQIGDALGITRQGAYQRYGSHEETAGVR